MAKNLTLHFQSLWCSIYANMVHVQASAALKTSNNTFPEALANVPLLPLTRFVHQIINMFDSSLFYILDTEVGISSCS